ncbi:EAL domain-containing protein [Agrobacterium vitis]|uniref:EAL domain-containing protein n=1 Tax=Agrobacterium vitis TaxID=373 RepID=A0AAE5AXN2_AGRVI|nr:EAL domain-containing protein [Agrobacterium vitis]MCF1497624.1 EAL domain-containing protein [Allorhizobium sp. Av2]MCM2441487.1 EAL domain-containing protein [Agrobacterium vitis]MUZ59425.1 EAL domain-containing protein [Agrobacterium vitis]MVA67944.1 EAL domain-containing protein [Agrobacterium vitis]MVA89694.1 EAL domain-containing protein [Agrobacterium vitis]
MTACAGCRDGATFDAPFSMAFQPIVDTRQGTIFGYEALVRGMDGAGAASVMAGVNAQNRYAFDQTCRVKAIQLAADLLPVTSTATLSINFMPNAVYEPRACIGLTLKTAERVGFPLNRILFEFTENEQIDTDHLLNILKTYRSIGFKTAIDDFGAGHAGLTLLAKFQPDIVKLDMELVRGIDEDRAKRIILRHTLAMLGEFGILPLCEGVETKQELDVLKDMGVHLMQGYVLARPAFERFEQPDLADVA